MMYILNIYIFFLLLQVFYKEFVHPEPLSPEKQEVYFVLVVNEHRSERKSFDILAYPFSVFL